MGGAWTRATRSTAAGDDASDVDPLLIRGALSPPHPSDTFYDATKAEVFILTPRFASPTLITVNAVAPSFVRTDTTLTGPCVCLALDAHSASRRALRVYTRLANKLRAWCLWAVAKGKLEDGKAEAAPFSEITAIAARTAAAATGLKTADAARSAVAKPKPLTGAAAFAPVLRPEQDCLEGRLG